MRGVAWRCVVLRGVHATLQTASQQLGIALAMRIHAACAKAASSTLSRLLPPPPPPAAHAMTGDRSGTGERSGVAHGVRGWRRRVGNAHPSGGRDSCKRGSLLAVCSPGRARLFPSTPRRSSWRPNPTRRPCGPRAGQSCSASNFAPPPSLGRAPIQP